MITKKHNCRETLIKFSLLDKLYLLSLVLVTITMILPNHFNSMAIIFACVILVFDYANLRKYFIEVKSNLVALSMIIIFLMSVISLSYSTDVSNGINILERALGLIILPIIISKLTIFPDFFFLIKRAFVWSVTIAVLICFYGAIYESFFENGGYSKMAPEKLYLDYFFHRFTYHKFSEHIGMHAVYFSAYTAFSSLILLSSGLKKGLLDKVQLAVLVLATILLKSIIINFAFTLGVVYILEKQHHDLKNIFFVTTSGVIVTLYHVVNKATTQIYFFQDVKYNVLFILSILCSLFFSWIVTKYKILSNKNFVYVSMGVVVIGYMIFIFSLNKQGDSLRSYNNLETRLFNWQSSMEIIKRDPIFGVGVGDVENKLDEVYERNGLFEIRKKKFNEHSQYLNYWSAIGILGIFSFLTFLFTNLKIALNSRNLEYFGLTVLCLFFCFTESVFLRNNGLVFFVFFMTANSIVSISKSSN